jgi:hypothetical protein
MADPRTDWATSGLGQLTGRPDGPPLGPPPGLVPGVRALASDIARDSALLGHGVDVDPLAVVAARARLGGMRRRGPVSCGGSARLLPTADGWLAVSLARPSDWELVAAWLGLASPVPMGDWHRVESAVAALGGADLLVRSEGLGLPVARVGERPAGDTGGISVRRFREGRPPSSMSDLVVADLSALWAGPLVGALLVRSGAHVVKVESSTRPDGARAGTPAHFGSLDDGKESLVVDLGSSTGRAALHRVVDGADVVLTASRPRAVAQLGLDPETAVGGGRTRVWLSISGYGSRPGDRERVAFGDDAAAAAGLVVWDARGPCFCADAVADPLTGLAATAAVLAALAHGGHHLIEASMADVAAGLVGEPAPAAGDPHRSIGSG